MDSIKKEMLKIYKPISNLDWMNYKLVKKDITYHHIVKKEHGGLKTIDNGALLMPSGHEYLHLIEFKDIDIYIAINKIFRFINDQHFEPTREQREIIEYLLQKFEKEHKEDKTSKGKQLIKYKYLERSLYEI